MLVEPDHSHSILVEQQYGRRKLQIVLPTFTLSNLIDNRALAISLAKQNEKKAEMILKETVARTLEVPSYNRWPGLIPKLGKRTCAQTELVMQALQYPAPS